MAKIQTLSLSRRHSYSALLSLRGAEPLTVKDLLLQITSRRQAVDLMEMLEEDGLVDFEIKTGPKTYFFSLTRTGREIADIMWQIDLMVYRGESVAEKSLDMQHAADVLAGMRSGSLNRSELLGIARTYGPLMRMLDLMETEGLVSVGKAESGNGILASLTAFGRRIADMIVTADQTAQKNKAGSPR